MSQIFRAEAVRIHPSGGGTSKSHLELHFEDDEERELFIMMDPDTLAKALRMPANQLRQLFGMVYRS